MVEAAADTGPTLGPSADGDGDRTVPAKASEQLSAVEDSNRDSYDTV